MPVNPYDAGNISIVDSPAVLHMGVKKEDAG